MLHRPGSEAGAPEAEVSMYLSMSHAYSITKVLVTCSSSARVYALQTVTRHKKIFQHSALARTRASPTPHEAEAVLSTLDGPVLSGEAHAWPSVKDVKVRQLCTNHATIATHARAKHDAMMKTNGQRRLFPCLAEYRTKILAQDGSRLS